ncbi:hypothetical protein DC522_01315 [Microvirga sp. KLBC 81]|uniref:hypothetical protein n=1 Tax=Microvirga sp. KLBC 81 TaxID=1862707 RepID=UPI000D50E2ED|nr:hypothetical protein [Microvirga sp. KLBC 81]PVE26431.1 hypothetical protein DC522_01315 [Microvirga sp. KLBC 81]
MTGAFVLDLAPDCVKQPIRYDLAIVEAAMLWPDDEGARDAWLRAARLETLRHPPEGVADHDFLRELFAMALETPRILDLNPAANERMRHGTVAGWVFHEAVRRSDINGLVQFGSVAADVTEFLAKRLRGKIRISKKTFDNAIWPRFRSVAHFWAAYVSNTLYASEQSQAFPCRLDGLVPFLGISEAYRLKGETLRGKQAADTLLRPSETVRIPTNLQLPMYGLSFSAPS